MEIAQLTIFKISFHLHTLSDAVFQELLYLVESKDLQCWKKHAAQHYIYSYISSIICGNWSSCQVSINLQSSLTQFSACRQNLMRYSIIHAHAINTHCRHGVIAYGNSSWLCSLQEIYTDYQYYKYVKYTISFYCICPWGSQYKSIY